MSRSLSSAAAAGLLIGAAIACLPATSLAQWADNWGMSPGAFSSWAYNAEADKALRRNHRMIFGQSVEESLKGGRSRGTSFHPGGVNKGRSTSSSALAPSTIFEGEATGATASKLSAGYPAANRAEAERVFRELLKGYAKIERQFGISRHDEAGSVAAFIAGSYIGYRNIDFPDENFKPLVAQMRQVLDANPDFAKASNAEKQEMYEQMAILGMFMATTQMALKEKPNPQIAANLKQAAKGYLEQFLKTDAERVQITAQGLVLR
jgi:hypothetical protein